MGNKKRSKKNDELELATKIIVLITSIINLIVSLLILKVNL